MGKTYNSISIAQLPGGILDGRLLGPRRGDTSPGLGVATLPAVDGRGPAISGSLLDLGEAFSDGRREILPPFVDGLDGVHFGVGADASQEQDD